MKIYKKVILFLIIVFSCLCLNGCSGKSDKPEEIKEKSIQEIEYFSFKIINILNNLNGISIETYIVSSKESQLTEKSNSNSFSGAQSGGGSSSQEGSSSQGGNSSSQGSSEGSSQSGTSNTTISTTQMTTESILTKDGNSIDWSSVTLDIELINSAWNIAMLDLYDLNVPNDEILNFSNKLNECTINIKEQNKQNALIAMSELYAFLPKYLTYISAENSRQNIYQTQSSILSAYALVEQENWTAISDNLVKAETSFISVVNDLEYIKNREYKVNKTYLAIKELQNSVSSNDKKLFYLKYKNLMESMNTL